MGKYSPTRGAEEKLSSAMRSQKAVAILALMQISSLENYGKLLFKISFSLSFPHLHTQFFSAYAA